MLTSTGRPVGIVVGDAVTLVVVVGVALGVVDEIADAVAESVGVVDDVGDGVGVAELEVVPPTWATMEGVAVGSAKGVAVGTGVSPGGSSEPEATTQGKKMRPPG